MKTGSSGLNLRHPLHKVIAWSVHSVSNRMSLSRHRLLLFQLETIVLNMCLPRVSNVEGLQPDSGYNRI
ncbi:MAG: hypothetical protein PHF70_05645 [Opitutales bacterium]|nr:hypothetical protein [Opitutales bacterium]